MPRIPYKIILTEAQKKALDLIGTNQVLLYDDPCKILVDRTYKPIDLLVFNSLDMIGILIFNRKIGPNVYLYKVNKNYLMKVKA